MKKNSSIASSMRQLASKEPVRFAQQGFTLIELLIAMVISLVIVIAATSALLLSRQGFSTVDAASQLRDDARFATDVIQRMGVQTGFMDVIYAATNRPKNIVGIDPNPPPNVFGFNNSTVDTTNPFGSATARVSGTAGYGSDILVLRYQQGQTFPGSGASDGTMFNCAGSSATGAPDGRDARIENTLHVRESKGELALMCTTAAGSGSAQPLVKGIETFQVLYGVDGVVANTAPSAATTKDSVADRFLRADQMTVPGNLVGTNENWRRVRSIRIGMVLRGPAGSAQQSIAQTLYPLGLAKASSGGALGSAMSSANDPGTIFVTPADSRLRQVVTFTIHLRNEQGL
jgi:type IV pilus assembly protein PilW